jgi:hypothetical protein
MDKSVEEVMASLEPPGAGIAWYYLAANRLVVRPFIERPMRWERALEVFAARHRRVCAALEGLAPAQLERRVLVPRLAGLEDSSRYWSPAMVCRHLEHVGSLIVDVIVRLSREEVVPERVDFAAVKPVDVPASTTKVYEAFANGVAERLAREVVNRRAPGTVPHPWFGELDAKGWLWLLGFHTWVHARQLEAIRSGLVTAPQ